MSTRSAARRDKVDDEIERYVAITGSAEEALKLKQAQLALEKKRAMLVRDPATATPPTLATTTWTSRFATSASADDQQPTHIFRCVGGCDAKVARRGDYCPSCAARAAEAANNMRLNEARESISPEGARDWCVPGNETYVAATQKAFALAKHLKPRDTSTLFQHVFEMAAWTPEIGNMLIVGPTGIGKSKVLAAIGLKLIADARKSGTEEARRFASGIVWASGLELARARGLWSLGADEPPLIRRAKRATLLLIDEIGFEDDRLDPHAVRDVLRYRYEPNFRPTIAASGGTLDELHLRYGEPTVRLVWDLGDRGHLVDLHEAAAAAKRARTR